MSLSGNLGQGLVKPTNEVYAMSKRSLEQIELNDESNGNQKKKFIKLQSESSDISDEDEDEEKNSLQDRSTDYVRDTSDTSVFDIEYDVEETRDSNFIVTTSEESELQDIAELGAVVAAVTYDSNFDLGLYADTSEECSTSPTSNSDVDPGLPRTDYLDFGFCAICRTDKKDSSYPYCGKCYQYKKNMCPPRPGRRKRKAITSSQESGVELSSASQVSDRGDGDAVDGPSTAVESQQSNIKKDSKDLCSICFVKPVNALFVHNSSAHSYGCYSCAMKTWASIKYCPLCRRRATVVRLLN